MSPGPPRSNTRINTQNIACVPVLYVYTNFGFISYCVLCVCVCGEHCRKSVNGFFGYQKSKRNVKKARTETAQQQQQQNTTAAHLNEK